MQAATSCARSSVDVSPSYLHDRTRTAAAAAAAADDFGNTPAASQLSAATAPHNGYGTGVNPAGDAGDTSPQYFGWGNVSGNTPPNTNTYFRI